MRTWQRQCINCGEAFTAKGANHRYCQPCGIERAKLRNREKARRYWEKHRKGAKRRKGKPRLETGYIGNRVFQRKCRACGETFKTGSGKGYYCAKCQKLRTIRLNRAGAKRRGIRRRNSGRRNTLGTLGKRHLQVVKGRIYGAQLLEKGREINVEHYFGRWQGTEGGFYAGSSYYLMRLCKDKLYCGECGADVIVARRNHTNYTISVELCCKGCGLVYELDDLQPA